MESWQTEDIEKVIQPRWTTARQNTVRTLVRVEFSRSPEAREADFSETGELLPEHGHAAIWSQLLSPEERALIVRSRRAFLLRDESERPVLGTLERAHLSLRDLLEVLRQEEALER